MFSDNVVKSNLPTILPLGALNTLVNKHTGNSGDDNYILKYFDEEIIIDDDTKDLKLVEVLANDEENYGKYVIDCFEIKAKFIWGKDIVIKNATKRKLKAEVTYVIKDFAREKDRK